MGRYDDQPKVLHGHKQKRVIIGWSSFNIATLYMQDKKQLMNYLIVKNLFWALFNEKIGFNSDRSGNKYL